MISLRLSESRRLCPVCRFSCSRWLPQRSEETLEYCKRPCVQLRDRLRSEHAYKPYLAWSGPNRGIFDVFCSQKPYEGFRQVANHWNPYGEMDSLPVGRELCGNVGATWQRRKKSRATRCDRVALFSIESRSSCFPIKLFGGGAVLPAPSPVN